MRTRLTPDGDGYAYDFVVVGSGFGGSVSALRLAERGYRVLVVEAGRRWAPADFPPSNWHVRRYLWAPELGCYGIQRIRLLPDALVLAGAGVGGGSLVYANTLYEPTGAAFAYGWPGGDWQARLEPHYEVARRVLGATRTPRVWAGDECLHDFATSIGRGDTFAATNVAVHFGDEPDRDAGDPFFEGLGPPRRTCRLCGGCMVGCRFAAKNTLDMNYLHLAQKLGAEVRALTEVTLLEADGAGGWRVHTRPADRPWARRGEVLLARGVVLAAGVLGTVELLLRCRRLGTLPDLPAALGAHVRTNSEVICGATARRPGTDYSAGIAIASSIRPAEDTTLEVVRYAEGSDFMGFLATLLTDGGNRVTRPLRWLAANLRHPLDALRVKSPRGWAKRTVIVLAMQTVDNELRLELRRRRLWPVSRVLTSRRSAAAPPAFIAQANDAARFIAARIGGFPASAVNEVFLNTPTTAHILGGACMADAPERGVVDARNRVFGHDNLWVVDGSSVPANLGVNPSLTIVAIAEHAMSLVPAKNREAGLRHLPERARGVAVRA